MKISIIVPAYNEELHLLENLIKIKNSFESNSFSDYEIIVCDNNSTDNSVELVKESFSQIKIIKSDTNRGYAGGGNLGANSTNAEFLSLCSGEVPSAFS